MSARHVLVTGASTGIGFASAVGLAKKGYHVFAGVRKTADGDRLLQELVHVKSGGMLEPIQLDVTNAGQIKEAADHITGVTGKAGLRGLVNNAGISVVGPLEFIPMEDFKHQMRVNVSGLLAVTQAFLPLLRAASGRLCLVSSTNGFLAVPFMGPYSASKFAVEAIGDSLRVELAPWKIRMSIVQPGSTQTAIWEKSKSDNEALLARMPEECYRLYGEAIKTMRGFADKLIRDAAPVEDVADCVTHAITAKNPKTRYRCGSGAKVAGVFAWLAPDVLRDVIIRKITGL